MNKDKAYDKLMEDILDIVKNANNDNANVGDNASAKMLQIAERVSKEAYLNALIPKKYMELHREGYVRFHDLGWFAKTFNCFNIPLKKALEQGFKCGRGFIRPPKRISSAAELSCILLEGLQNDMFGGQAYSAYDTALAPYAEKATDEEMSQAMQAVVYNLNSMASRAGCQVPFSSINLGLDTSEGGRKVTKHLLLEYEKGLGKGEAPKFPNLLFQVKEGINTKEGDPNYDLFKLACRVASKRLFPSFVNCSSSFNKNYPLVSYMGCRTRVVTDIHGEDTPEGRGNLFFTSINLPLLALESDNLDDFKDKLSKLMTEIYDFSLFRYDVVKNLKVKDLPFVMGEHFYIGSEGLSDNDTIEPAVKHGSISIGFVGLAEALKCLFGKHHGESEEVLQEGLKIVADMAEITDSFTEKSNLNFSLFSTPAEQTAGSFRDIIKEKYGVIDGITDKEYLTNSFHLPVGFESSIENKLRIEGQFHKYCLAGHITHIELNAPPLGNSKVIEDIVHLMLKYDIGYGKVNFPLDRCMDCDHQGVFQGDTCPVCGGSNLEKLRVISGYVAPLDQFNKAKQAEVRDRVSHYVISFN